MGTSVYVWHVLGTFWARRCSKIWAHSNDQVPVLILCLVWDMFDLDDTSYSIDSSKPASLATDTDNSRRYLMHLRHSRSRPCEHIATVEFVLWCVSASESRNPESFTATLCRMCRVG